MKTILCVDDSAASRMWLSSSLRENGYNVVTASDAEEALRRLYKHPVDMILTNLVQPDMDGIEFTQVMRSDRKYRFTSIIIMTTESQEYRMQEARESRASAWITKSCTAERLKTIVARFI